MHTMQIQKHFQLIFTYHTFTPGTLSFNFLEIPVTVPPVPADDTSMSNLSK